MCYIVKLYFTIYYCDAVLNDHYSSLQCHMIFRINSNMQIFFNQWLETSVLLNIFFVTCDLFEDYLMNKK